MYDCVPRFLSTKTGRRVGDKSCAVILNRELACRWCPPPALDQPLLRRYSRTKSRYLVGRELHSFEGSNLLCCCSRSPLKSANPALCYQLWAGRSYQLSATYPSFPSLPVVTPIPIAPPEIAACRISPSFLSRTPQFLLSFLLPNLTLSLPFSPPSIALSRPASKWTLPLRPPPSALRPRFICQLQLPSTIGRLSASYDLAQPLQSACAGTGPRARTSPN